jgi:hypothetical protein
MQRIAHCLSVELSLPDLQIPDQESRLCLAAHRYLICLAKIDYVSENEKHKNKFHRHTEIGSKVVPLQLGMTILHLC